MDRWQFQDVLHERGIPIVIEAQSAARDGRGNCLLFRFFEMIVADTNLVSTFARIGRLDLIFAVVETNALYLPPAVIKEIKTGLHKGLDFLQPLIDGLTGGDSKLLTNENRAHTYCLANQIPAFNLKLILRRLWLARHSAKEVVRALIEEIEISEPGMVIKGKDEIFR